MTSIDANAFLHTPPKHLLALGHLASPCKTRRKSNEQPGWRSSENCTVQREAGS